jgi:hypothetical protein
MNRRDSADMVSEEAMQPHFTAESTVWLALMDRRLRRLRRAMLLASAIAGCLAVVAIVEGVLLSWK